MERVAGLDVDGLGRVAGLKELRFQIIVKGVDAAEASAKNQNYYCVRRPVAMKKEVALLEVCGK